jgi:phosphatidylinositol-3,4,5-trisphosphate 3-phosphatase/dual-specificity protein phosphatase PTEN
MKIELELKIKEDEENDDADNALTTMVTTVKDKEKHEVLFSPDCSSLYSCVRPEASYVYDYEINGIKFGEEKEDKYMYIKANSKLLGDKYARINPETELHDTLDFPYSGDVKLLNNMGNIKLYKANILKRLVSKKKRRLQTEFFDLDMAYITERVIGMGFPATGCETLYRNSLADLKLYLDRFHGEYKIYNLCIEKKRIYPKEIWTDKKVGLFPFNDHAPCPIKLILDFCIDICLYLTINPKSVACIHCKAGKGRTGVMIVCYLLFSGLCQTADEALTHYASQRTLNGKGVTIPSQIRYIKYFETFLSANYERPFVRRIPKIIKVDLDRGYTNIITNYNTDMAYFTTINSFKLKKCLIGPFSEELDIQYDFSAITIKKLNFEKSKLTRKIINQGYYYEIEMCSDDIINYDLKLSIKSKKVKFYSWFNLWFNTFEIISKYVIKNNYFERERQTESNINRAMSQLEIEEAKKKKESDDMNGVEKKKLSKALGEIISNYDEARGKRKISAIKSMKNNKDLNNILNGIDRLARDLKIPVLDRENLEFTIERKQLDKLKTKLKDPFKVKYTYELLK